MKGNGMQKIFVAVKDFLVYKPTNQSDLFILTETEDDGKQENDSLQGASVVEAHRGLEVMLRYSRRLAAFMDKYSRDLQNGQWTKKKKELMSEYLSLEKQQGEINAILLSYNSNEGVGAERSISTSLEENRKIIEERYQLPRNKDVVIRKLTIAGEPSVKAMLVFMDGLADKKIVTVSILQPLMLMRNDRQEYEGGNLIDGIIERFLPSGQASRVASFKEVEYAINTGDAALFFEGIDEVVTLETKGFEHRGIDRSATEQSVRGAQNAFTEVLRVNTALIRTMLHASDLVTEMIPVGLRGETNCAVMYLESVANKELVAEVKRRITGISADIIMDSGVLEHFIVDFPNNPFPQTLSTERPDRIVANIAEGRVAIFLDGNPFGQIVPVSFFTLIHAADDYSLNLYYANMLRIVRLVGAFLSLLLPALYLAINTFHQEAIPTDLLLSIIAARSSVPFPTIIEIMLMEISFELIREGGLRIPGILGSTIGIVGALILGQAAVAAKIASPIMVIVIAVTGLASYSIPDYRLASALRLSRLAFIALAFFMGLVGIASGFMVLITVLCSMKSFGMSYMAPLAPKTMPGGDLVFRIPVYKQQRRPDEVNSQDYQRQGEESRKWVENSPVGDDK